MDNFIPDYLKPFEKILEPDWRTSVTAGSDGDRASLEDFYKMICKIQIQANVNNDIKAQFETAKNSLLYAWFSYRLGMLAAKHAISTVELALRLYIATPDKPRIALNSLLEKSNSEGMVNFKKIKPNMKPESLIKYIKDFRNNLAHGSHTLVTTNAIFDYLEICAAIINQLFDHVHQNKLKPTLGAWQ